MLLLFVLFWWPQAGGIKLLAGDIRLVQSYNINSVENRDLKSGLQLQPTKYHNTFLAQEYIPILL